VDLHKMRTWKDELVVTLAKGLSQLAQHRQVQAIQARATFEASNQVRLRGDAAIGQTGFLKPWFVTRPRRPRF
jgi:pyruvate/2-oxoglutarate dehydrogenase complex dihydrolipoamide dehydrogenase (E3) component